MKEKEIKIGMVVKSTKDCYSAKRGRLYVVEADQLRSFCITGDNGKSWCNCHETWSKPTEADFVHLPDYLQINGVSYKKVENT